MLREAGGRDPLDPLRAVGGDEVNLENKIMKNKISEIKYRELRQRLAHRRLSTVADSAGIPARMLAEFASGRMAYLHHEDVMRLEVYFKMFP